jgi:hypothetical protein
MPTDVVTALLSINLRHLATRSLPAPLFLVEQQTQNPQWSHQRRPQIGLPPMMNCSATAPAARSCQQRNFLHSPGLSPD